MRATAPLTRREALAALTSVTLARRSALAADAAAEAPFRFAALDHIALAVEDTEKSVHSTFPPLWQHGIEGENQPAPLRQTRSQLRRHGARRRG